MQLLFDDFDYKRLLERSGATTENGSAVAGQVKKGFLQIGTFIQNVPNKMTERY